MKRIIILFTIVISVLSLTGCGNWGQHYLTNISNKNAGSIKTTTPQTTTTPTQNQKCNQWCHNGWCSTHCETITN